MHSWSEFCKKRHYFGGRSGLEKRCRVGIRAHVGAGGGGGGCDGGDRGGGAIVVAFLRPLPTAQFPEIFPGSVCKISEFHVALFRYVTHVPLPTPPFAAVLIAPISQPNSRVLLPLYRPLTRTQMQMHWV